MVTYRITLAYILVINLINVIYVVKDLVRMLAYRNTLECTLVIDLINVIRTHTGDKPYVVKDLVYITFIRFITSMCSNVCL
jgi:hypothetical protein